MTSQAKECVGLEKSRDYGFLIVLFVIILPGCLLLQIYLVWQMSNNLDDLMDAASLRGPPQNFTKR